MQYDSLNKRIWLKGLALECPLGKPAHDCPLNGVRCLPPSQISSSINFLTDESIAAIAEYHELCYASRREQKQANELAVLP